MERRLSITGLYKKTIEPYRIISIEDFRSKALDPIYGEFVALAVDVLGVLDSEAVFEPGDFEQKLREDGPEQHLIRRGHLTADDSEFSADVSVQYDKYNPYDSGWKARLVIQKSGLRDDISFTGQFNAESFTLFMPERSYDEALYEQVRQAISGRYTGQ